LRKHLTMGLVSAVVIALIGIAGEVRISYEPVHEVEAQGLVPEEVITRDTVRACELDRFRRGRRSGKGLQPLGRCMKKAIR
jgi:hypothetical protein